MLLKIDHDILQKGVEPDTHTENKLQQCNLNIGKPASWWILSVNKTAL